MILCPPPSDRSCYAKSYLDPSEMLLLLIIKKVELHTILRSLDREAFVTFSSLSAVPLSLNESKSCKSKLLSDDVLGDTRLE